MEKKSKNDRAVLGPAISRFSAGYQLQDNEADQVGAGMDDIREFGNITWMSHGCDKHKEDQKVEW